MCLVVCEIPNSGYVLRFTQQYACLRTSTKPVDMPEDRAQTPQLDGSPHVYRLASAHIVYTKIVCIRSLSDLRRSSSGCIRSTSACRKQRQHLVYS